MNNANKILGFFLMSALVLTSCDPKDDDVTIVEKDIPTAQDFKDLKAEALENQIQLFHFDANEGHISFTSEKGVQININSNCLTLNGNPITGTVDLEYVELFDKGNMLTTNKPTMGTMPNGDKAMLLSGGEFFLEATQNGEALGLNCSMQLQVPHNLTGGADPAMTLWEGEIDQDDNLTWDNVDTATGQGGVFVEGAIYYTVLQGFGWSNIDRFYNDPRPKTVIQAQAPTGYNNTNSSIYLSYDGEDTGLAALDTYANGLFSEHYGQIPIGLECHAIFVTEDNGLFRYAIKAVTIADNDVITFTLGETVVVTEAQITNAINALP